MSKKPEEPKKLIGITAYANYRKCTLSNVQEKLRKGKIPFVMYNGKRMIDPESADIAWLANVSSHKPNEQYKIDDAGTGPKAEISIGQQKTNVPNIHIEEAYFKAYRTRLARLEYEIKSGKLIERDNVYRQTFTAIRIIRDAMLNIPQKISPELASEVDPHKVELILQKEIHECLTELGQLAKRYEQ